VRLLRALRPYQWAKNSLLFLPALAAHRPIDGALLATLGAAFASFSLVASGVYLANDVADREHDRRHPRKRLRAVASGAVSPGAALGASVVLQVAGLAAAWWLPRPFFVSLVVYLVLTALYSLGLKTRVALDVVILAALYTVRVVAGAVAVDVPLSRWFLAFSVFLFMSLALLKRAAEALGADGAVDVELGGRGWRPADLPILVAFGAGAAMAAGVVYCLYITGEDVLRLYSDPDLLWLGFPVLLYWLTRSWLLALRGELHDDPVLFALRDLPSWACLLVFAATVWLAA
jgi:4-hydroxybenzoate polyprenyltransferase